MTHARRRTAWLIVLLVLATVVLTIGYLAYELRLGRQVAVTISRETTYLTGPLRDDGFVDYLAAMNQLASEGVTPENNAAVLFWQAMGPDEIDREDREEYSQVLGIAPLPPTGDYFVDLNKFVEGLSNEAVSAGLEAKDKREEASKQQDAASKRPWSKEEFPVLAEWLAANEKPLALIAEASKRPRRYDPLARSKNGTLMGASLPADQAARNAACALVARAMLELHEGKIDDAWEDLLTCHRLARLVGQGMTLIDALVALRVDSLAYAGDQAMLQHVQFSSAQVAKMCDSLARLPPVPKVVDKINVHERCACLDILACEVPTAVGSISVETGGGKSAKASKLPIASRWMATIDLDPILCTSNAWFDRIVDACRRPTRAERKQLLTKIDETVNDQITQANNWKSFVWAVLVKRRRSEVVLTTIGQVSLACMLPTTSGAVDAEDRATMQFELTKLAFALAAYRADNGSYPAALAELTPKYVAEVHKDIFSDSDLHYQRDGDGYLLYSVGVNGRDDGGRGIDDRKADENNSDDWDDLAVRVGR